MIRTLLRKELAEHGFIFAAVFAITLLGFLLVFVGSILREVGSALDAVRIFGVSLYILTCLAVCNRLVVQEYSGKTQLFLEGLPLSRAVMLGAKYCLGLLMVGTAITLCFGIALVIASRQEMIGLRFLQIMTVRLLVFVFCTYSFFFMMGLLGRYRIPIYICLVLGTILLSEATALDLSTQGPFALLDDRFAYERMDFPVRPFVESLVAGVVFVVIAMLMGLVREGSIAGLLAERMSHREKLFVAAIIFGMLFTGYLIDEKQTPDPYAIADAYTRDDDGVVVHVEDIASVEAAANLADQIHTDLSGIREYLAIEDLPELFMVNRRDLDADRFEPARLRNASGVLLRANYASDEWSYAKFQPFLIDVSLSRASHYNAVYEPQCWVLEGFSEYWPRQAAFDADWNANAKVDLRAAYGASLGLLEKDIQDWYRLRERVGEPIARAIGCSGLVLAEREYGPERLQAFLRGVMRLDQPDDFRADLDRFRRPIAEVWKRNMGSEYRDFVQRWLTELESLSKSLNDSIGSIPRLSAEGTWVPKSELTYQLNVALQCEPEEQVETITVRFKEISVFDVWDSGREVESETEPFESGSAIQLSETFAVGTRVLWTVSVAVPQLDCDVISGWRRDEVK